MEIDCQCEFGYELQLVIPYAYYLYKNNLLKQTASTFFTKELYYFSNNHQEKYSKRECIEPNNVPNKYPHVTELNYDEYLPPPYKENFKNDYFIFDKPIMIIHNKYNEEWLGPPVNFIDKDTLEKIFSTFHSKYQIIYIRPQSNNIVSDGCEIFDLKEKELFSVYGILDGNELYKEVKDKYNISNFNHFQLLLHSNCDHFISVQGGNSVLASYFGGTNIIFAREGHELQCNSYNSHYKKYSNCNVMHSNNYAEFIELIKSNY